MQIELKIMSEEKYQYELRAHHGLCLCFFKQKGYDDEFTQNKQKIKNELEKNLVVRIISQADEICGKCPNNICGICKSSEKVAEYDRQVITVCNISDGEIMPFLEFKDLIRKNILFKGKRKEICGNCEWDSLCGY